MPEIIAFGLGGITVILLLLFIGSMRLHEECPREIRGYQCKGSLCDHDPELVSQAKHDIGPTNYWGQQL